MSFEIAVQTAVYTALRSNAALLALLEPEKGVYDSVPDGTAFPYVTIGEDVHNEWDTDQILGSDCSITLHTWSQSSGDVEKRGRKEVKQIQGAIYEALHRQSLTYVGYKFINVDRESSRSFMDADGKTWHGVQTFRVLIERV